MESEKFKKETAVAIRDRIAYLNHRGVKTTTGEKISVLAIARACNPPVSGPAVHNVINGKDIERIRREIERQLGMQFWVRKAA